MSRTIVINGLILRARGYMFRCEIGQKTVPVLVLLPNEMEAL
jgi:hypothetical protein